VPVEQVVTVLLPSRSTPALWAALTAAGRGVTGAVRVVVLRAEAADFFDCAPVDGRDVDGRDADDRAADGPDDEPPAAAIEWLGSPDLITVAAINGRAVGAGLDVALACDLRVVADDAQLAPSRSVGTVVRLGELMGYPRALAFLLAGGVMLGRDAVASGLANLSVAPEKLDAAVAELVATVLSTPREVATVAKAALRDSAADRRRVAGELVAGIRLAANDA
jgi:enoyl-CoA hydratase/carnithine racemase